MSSFKLSIYKHWNIEHTERNKIFSRQLKRERTRATRFKCTLKNQTEWNYKQKKKWIFSVIFFPLFCNWRQHIRALWGHCAASYHWSTSIGFYVPITGSLNCVLYRCISLFIYTPFRFKAQLTSCFSNVYYFQLNSFYKFCRIISGQYSRVSEFLIWKIQF